MDADLDLLCVSVYVTADDLLPGRPAKARRKLTDAEIVTLCVRRRSGARCWLDQELGCLMGVTHYRPAAAVSLYSDRHHRILGVESEDQRDACR